MDPIMSNSNLFPSFFQALPNYSIQCLAIIQLLRHYNWTWIGVITSDDDFGEKQSQELKTKAANYEICVEYIVKIRDSIQIFSNYYESLKIINKSSSQVIVICGTFSVFIVFFIGEELKAREKTFIIPAGWIANIVQPTIARSPFHGSLVFSPPAKKMPDLRNFLQEISPRNRPDDILLANIIAFTFQCFTSGQMRKYLIHLPLHECNRTIKLGELGNNVYYTDRFRVTYLVYKSVYAMAHALHEMQSQIAKNIKYQENQRLLQKLLTGTCCSDSVSCQKCPEDQWPNYINQCVPKPIEFLSYKNDRAVLAISAISVLCFLKTSAILGIFILFQDTPVVQANNHTLSFILLVSIMLSFLCVFLFLGHPTNVTCMLRQTSFGIIFSVAVSSILAKTIMVYMAFKATKPGTSWRRLIGVRITNCVVFFCSFIQVLLSIIWLSTSPPFPEMNTHLYQDKIIFQCNEGSMVAFSMLLGYMGLLAAISFIVAFLARHLPDCFNEAKNITFSMLVVCSVWVAFIPSYMSVSGKNTVLVEIFAVISSSAGILGCIFFPKCYIILVRPELNSKRSLSRQMKANSST
ncbi:vomeronasal type-2 receptor 26-like [Ranitomeya variabilis]|uniref:vomeronasal type-2 receptor 26-like n=1 Tax=Ranitomeya variabilis TaxID=490064 RepID=UPI004055BD8E